MKHLLLPALLAASLHTAAQSATALYDAAATAYAAGRMDSAKAELDRAIRQDPALAKAYKLRGDVLQHLRNPEAALADYHASEKLDPGDPRLYVSRSALYISEGNGKAGLREADKAIALDPKDADAWYNKAWALYQGTDLDAALKSVRKALDLQPEFPEALYLSGVIKGARYDEKEGVAEIEQALKLKPAIPGGLMSLAVLLYEGKHYEEAISKFSQVIATDTTELASAYYYRADCHYNLKDKEKACADWRQSMRLGDRDAAFIKKNYCDTDANKIPKKPNRKRRQTTIQF